MLQLQQMLDETAEPGSESAWSAEIERRIEAYEHGEVATSAWEDVRASAVGQSYRGGEVAPRLA